MNISNPTDYVFVPIRSACYADLLQHMAEEFEPGAITANDLISDLVESYLQDENADTPVLQKAEEHRKFLQVYGAPERGYQWKTVFLPNGTPVRMTYAGEDTYAEIRHQRLCLGDEPMSPSEFARRVASNTNRNAWRDIYVRLPGHTDWVLADTLRRQRP